MDGLLSKYESENCNPTVLPLKPSDVDMIERIPIPVTPAPKHVRAIWLEARSGGGAARMQSSRRPCDDGGVTILPK